MASPMTNGMVASLIAIHSLGSFKSPIPPVIRILKKPMAEMKLTFLFIRKS